MKPKGGLLLGGLNKGVCGRPKDGESADEERDGSSLNGIQGQEPRRWWEEIKGSYDWRRISERERRASSSGAPLWRFGSKQCVISSLNLLDKDAETKEKLDGRYLKLDVKRARGSGSSVLTHRDDL